MMPNWCKGTLKVRGTIKSLERVITEGLQPVTFLGADLPPLKVTDENGCLYCESDAEIYIDCTHRGFIDEKLYIDLDYDDKEDFATLALDARFAWDIEAEQLLNFAKKYNVDIKIYAFEMGMEFNRDIEIVDGKLIKNETITFDDYIWDCPCPQIGG